MDIQITLLIVGGIISIALIIAIASYKCMKIQASQDYENMRQRYQEQSNTLREKDNEIERLSRIIEAMFEKDKVNIDISQNQ